MAVVPKERPARTARPRPVRIVPCLRYRDPAAAIDWLCVAFGFERHLIVSGEDGAIAHAELTLGDAMVMLGPAIDSDFGKLMVQPDEVGGRETQTAYVVVPDADTHHDQAVAAGAEIVIEIKSEEYGGRGYTCRDIEGHIWNFGTYDPWAQPDPTPDRDSKATA